MTESQIGELFAEYQNYLYIVIQNHLYDGCPSDYIYDCLDDVFAIALEKKDDPKFNRDPGGWLVITARNVVSNFNRTTLIHERFVDSNFDFDLHEIPVFDNSLEDAVLQIALNEKIWTKVYNALDPEERVLLVMRYYQKKEPKEIAKELGISVCNAKVRISRMKAHAKKLIHRFVEAD